MRSLLVLLAAAAVLAAACADTDVQCRFTVWKLKFDKTYASPEEEAYRFGIFTKHILEELPKHKAENPHAHFAEGPFADLTKAEFAKFLSIPDIASRGNLTLPPAPAVPLPSAAEVAKNIRRSARSWEWRSPDISPVKNQGGCGSCWTFSAVGCAESAWHKANGGDFMDFSEQQIVDCYRDNGCAGCSGGWPDYALNYFIANGMMRESDYPYEARDDNCRFDGSRIVGKLTQIFSMPFDESVLDQRLQQYGPLSMCINANTLQGYSGGILGWSSSCDAGYDHAVLLVGYGHDDSVGDYWVVKNSWGTGWGESGFFRIIRGQNACHICDWLAVGAAAPTINVPTPDIPGTIKNSNVDITPGANDIISQAKSPVDCYAWCQQTNNCRAFIIAGNMCYLKTVNGPQVASGGKTAYLMMRASSVNFASDIAPGQCDIVSQAGVSQGDCAHWCAQTTGCLSFVMTQNTCFLKSCAGPVVGNGVSNAYVIVNKPPSFAGRFFTADLAAKDIAPGQCDIGAKTNSNDVDCNYYCQSMPGCRAYIIQGGNCWLKSCVEPVVDTSSDKSAHVMISASTDAANTDIAPGQCDIANYQTNAFFCMLLCHQTNACRAYVIAGSTCYLKSCYGPTRPANGITASFPSFASSAS